MIYAIGDLHLGFSSGKSMDIFGPQWKDHPDKIRASWLKKVTENDLVLLAGDISWAMSLKDGLTDLSFFDDLPGTKLLIKGNHDYWWPSQTQIKQNINDSSMVFLQNACYNFMGISICGARGWICPGDEAFTQEDLKVYLREVARLKLSLEKATPGQPVWVVMHFPPMNSNKEPNEFTQLFDDYGVKRVIFGHIHGEENFTLAPQGMIGTAFYSLVSADYLDFELAEIEDIRRKNNETPKSI